MAPCSMLPLTIAGVVMMPSFLLCSTVRRIQSTDLQSWLRILGRSSLGYCRVVRCTHARTAWGTVWWCASTRLAARGLLGGLGRWSLAFSSGNVPVGACWTSRGQLSSTHPNPRQTLNIMSLRLTLPPAPAGQARRPHRGPALHTALHPHGRHPTMHYRDSPPGGEVGAKPMGGPPSEG